MEFNEFSWITRILVVGVIVSKLYPKSDKNPRSSFHLLFCGIACCFPFDFCLSFEISDGRDCSVRGELICVATRLEGDKWDDSDDRCAVIAFWLFESTNNGEKREKTRNAFY